MEYPDAEEAVFLAWLMRIKQKLSNTEKSVDLSISATYTMTELRANDFLSVMFLKQLVVDSNTLWDGCLISNRDFLMTDSAICYGDFLEQRTTLFEYAATELRLIARGRTVSQN
jgi:nuclear pore complex protein Nup205